jgi:hypothetical protein
MLVTFTTDAYVDITLVGDVTLVMLKMRRHRAIVPGTIQAEDAPAALSRKTDAIEAENPFLTVGWMEKSDIHRIEQQGLVQGRLFD